MVSRLDRFYARQGAVPEVVSSVVAAPDVVTLADLASATNAPVSMYTSGIDEDPNQR